MTPAMPGLPKRSRTRRRTLNEGRGDDPGDAPTATPSSECWSWTTLNEGRGDDPGDAGPLLRALVAHLSPRSTKAGVMTPAMHDDAILTDRERVGAQRRPG